MTDIEIGIGKSGQRSLGLEDIAIRPSRRTRDPRNVTLSWTLDAYELALPLMSAAIDSVTSPQTAVEIGRLGGLGVLNLEGLWTRVDDADAALAEVASLPTDQATRRLRELHATPVDPDLIAARIAEIKQGGGLAAASLTPQAVLRWHDVALGAGLDVLVIQGTVVSAEHVSDTAEPLNLKDFIARYDIPVVVGGCASYTSALHLMRTGAAGILVGVGTGSATATRSVLGIGGGLATAIADVAGARIRHLEETGRHVQIIADGGMQTGGDIAKAMAVGADAVMLGTPLARATDAPGRGSHWVNAATHTLPRGGVVHVSPVGTLAQVVSGPAVSGDGATDLFGALTRSMALCGHETIKELQRADVTVTTAG